jgi:hypothetical protein
LKENDSFEIETLKEKLIIFPFDGSATANTFYENYILKQWLKKSNIKTLTTTKLYTLEFGNGRF